MPNSFVLKVAGINIGVTSQDSIAVEKSPPFYNTFLKQTFQRTDNYDMRVSLKLGSLPRLEGMDKIFDTERAWVLFEKNSEYYIEFGHKKKPLWVARINKKYTRATVYCSERLILHKGKELLLSNPVQYPLDQILLMYMLAQRQGALFHGAGIDLQGRGWVFLGRSGAGKSTLAKLLSKQKGSQIINDDRVVVRKIDGQFRAYGTPWPGDAGFASNKSSDLAGIFFITHGENNKIKEIDQHKATEKILPVVSIPWYDAKIMNKILDFCEDLVAKVPCFTFSFKPASSALHALAQFFLHS